MIELTYNQVIAINEQIVNRTGEPFSIINADVIKSSIGNQYQPYDSDEQAIASVFKSLILNHGFQNGNKRTAVACLKVFNVDIKCDDKELVDLVYKIASENGGQVSVNHVANVLFNLGLDESLNESINDTLYYHGSSQKGLTKLTSPINWITEDKEYAKYYALALSDTAYIYTCEADLDNVFDVGNTGLNVFALLPMTKPYKLSVEFANIYHKLNISNESARKLVEDALKEYPQNNEYRTKISTIVRSEAFKKLLQEKGYTSIHTIEYNVPYSRYCDCYGILDSNDVKILSSEEVTYDAKLNDK